jgi:phosphonoacetaldehyde methylase
MLAAGLHRIGYDDVHLIDAVIEDYNNIMPVGDDPSFVNFGLSDQGVLERISKLNPDLVGISALFSSQTECAFSIARLIKEAFPHLPLCMGGNHATECRQRVMQETTAIDFILAGEADFTFPEFVRAYFSDGDYRRTPGLLWREGERICENPMPPTITSLDTLPFPAWQLYDMERYYDVGMPHNPFLQHKRYGQIITSRGCPYKCYFCSVPDFNGSAFRSHSAPRVVEDVRQWVDNYSIKELQILDDTFTTDWKRVVDIMNGIRDFKLRITLPNAIRADYPKRLDQRKAMFQAMADAGVAQIDISVEHGDQDFLNNVIGKDLDLDTVPATCELAHDAGMTVHANFMMGFPFENSQGRQKTIDFARRLDADSFSISLCIPLPGTRMANVVALNGLHVDNFNLHRMTLNAVNIKPFDVSAEELKNIAESLNRELNEAAQGKRPATAAKYKKFREDGKTADGDRKFHFREVNEVKA